MFLARRNILSQKHPLEHLQRSQRLVERYFMPGLINSDKAKQVTLTNLSMNNAIRSGDIHEPRMFVPWGIDLLSNNLSTEPIAVIVAGTQISTAQ